MVRDGFRSVVDPAGPGEDLYGKASDGVLTADESCPWQWRSRVSVRARDGAFCAGMSHFSALGCCDRFEARAFGRADGTACRMVEGELIA